MRTFKHVSFLILLLTLVVARDQSLWASANPPDPIPSNCPMGCTCWAYADDPTVEYGYCPSIGSTLGCAYGYDSCMDYCFFDLPLWVEQWYQAYVSCWVDDMAWDCPENLESTSWECHCTCWSL